MVIFDMLKKKSINQISVLLLLVIGLSLSGCNVLGKSGGNKGCGCPSVNKRPVG